MMESPFLQFLWMVQGHLSLVHDLKKKKKKEKKNLTEEEGWKPLPVLKTWN